MKYTWGAIFETLMYGLWFLKAAFACFCCYSLIAYCKSKKIGNILLVITLIVSQFVYSYQFNLMYPCFILGVALKKYWPLLQGKRFVVAMISGVVFIAMLIQWDESFWYISDKAIYPLRSTKQFFSFLYPFYYRMAIGFVGSVFIIMLCDIICNKYSETDFVDFLSVIGKDTLGIYLIQSIVLETVLWRFAKFDNLNINLFQFVVAPLISFCVLSLCVAGIKILRYNPITARLFLGEAKI